MLIEAFVRSINDAERHIRPGTPACFNRLKPRAIDRIEIGAGIRGRSRLTYVIMQKNTGSDTN